MRPGDSTTDRLSRAKTLMGIASFDPVSRMLVARAPPWLTPTTRLPDRRWPRLLPRANDRPFACAFRWRRSRKPEYGDIGQSREWLARASRGSADPAWVAEGTVYDHWSPVSPTTGKLDAFRWQVPAERQGAAIEALPPRQTALQPRDPAPAASAAMPALENLGPTPTESSPTSTPANDVAMPGASNGHANAASPSAPVPVATTHLVRDDTDLPEMPAGGSEGQVAGEVHNAQTETLKEPTDAEAPAMTEAHPPSAKPRRDGIYTSG